MLYLFIRKIELPHYYASLKQQYRRLMLSIYELCKQFGPRSGLTVLKFVSDLFLHIWTLLWRLKDYLKKEL